VAADDTPRTTVLGLLLEVLSPSSVIPGPVDASGNTTVTVLAANILDGHRTTARNLLDAGVEVWAAIVRPTDAFDPTPPPPPRGVLLQPTGQVAQYSAPVHVVSSTLAGEEDDNKVVVWLKVNGAVVKITTQDFVARAPDQVMMMVSGKCCIYLAGVTNFTATPNGEDATCLPVAVTVPPDAVLVEVSAVGDWGCSALPEEQSGPTGLAENPEDVANGYAGLSPLVNVMNTSLPRNTLVGVFAPAAPPMPPVNADEIQMGADSGELVITQGSATLFLGLHDQSNWTDNQGSVSVTVTWS
jgi:hypothetical protein